MRTPPPRRTLDPRCGELVLYQELVRNDALDARGRLPAVLCTGEARWRAAVEVGEWIAPVGAELAPYRPSQRYVVVDGRHEGAEDLPEGNLMGAVSGLERSRGPGDLGRVVGRLVEWLRDPDDDGLKRAFADWVRQMAEGFEPGDAEPVPVRTLEGVRMTLVERVAEWPKQWFREGHEQGAREGREQGVETGSCTRTGAVAPHGGVPVRSADRRACVGRRGPGGSGRCGEWLVCCGTGSEFLARVDPAADGANLHGDRGNSCPAGIPEEPR